jgi:hypothetical protein
MTEIYADLGGEVNAALKERILSLEVGHNTAVWVRLGPPVGTITMPDGQEGELIGAYGEHIGWVVPGTVVERQGSGFGNATTRRYYFRAVVEDGERKVLVSGQVHSVIGLAYVKRLVDRADPKAKDAPRDNYSGRYR